MIAKNHSKPLAGRGSIYVTVLGVTTMVVMIGLTAVYVGRVQARSATTSNDFAQARIYARSGIELAMMAIANDPYWRTNLGNGVWFSGKPIGNGTFTLSVADPIDGDVATGQSDPVVLTSTGIKGAAKYIVSTRVDVGARLGSCLEVAICSSDDLRIKGVNLTSNQVISSNESVDSSKSSIISANVEARKGISGSDYSKATTVTGVRRTMPDAARVLDYYKANGTAISYSKLTRAGTTNLVSNNNFETNTADWYAQGGCTLLSSTAYSKRGTTSLRVTARGSSAAVAATDLPINSMVLGRSYAVDFPVYSIAASTMQVTLTVTTDTGTYTTSTPAKAVSAREWTSLVPGGSGRLTPSWTGAVTKATLTVQSSATSSYYLDALMFVDSSFPEDTYVMDGQLLSPTKNPYGAPNPEGVYVLDCGGKDVVVSNSRIVGTLLLLNPGSDTTVQGSMNIEPAVTNYPALMTDGSITVALSSTALSETGLGVNFNPVGAAYPYQAGTGTFTNATATDSYPSAINGLVYAGDDFVMDANTVIDGGVVVSGKTTLQGTTLQVNYKSVYLNTPPPGFTSGAVYMRPTPGSWQRSVN